MDISIVIPTYNEGENVIVLYHELKEALGKLNKTYEIIFIDDGSTDTTFKNLKEIHEKDDLVKIIKFRKNFGQTAAMDAGFKHAKGEIIISMDADLQNDPRDIPKLLGKIDEGYDVVSGWRKYRKDPFLKRFVSRGANILRKILRTDKVHDSGCTLKAYKRVCFEDLELYGEMHRFIPALLGWKGFKVTEVVVNHRPRQYGKTKYSINRVLKGFLDMLVVRFWMQYSARPIHLFGGLGIMMGLIGLIITIYLSVMRIFYQVSLANRPMLLLGILLVILGVQFMISGILADIMIKVYYGGEKRNYSIEKVVG